MNPNPRLLVPVKINLRNAFMNKLSAAIFDSSANSYVKMVV
jgi:hypothetical protein